MHSKTRFLHLFNHNPQEKKDPSENREQLESEPIPRLHPIHKVLNSPRVTHRAARASSASAYQPNDEESSDIILSSWLLYSRQLGAHRQLFVWRHTRPVSLCPEITSHGGCQPLLSRLIMFFSMPRRLDFLPDLKELIDVLVVDCASATGCSSREKSLPGKFATRLFGLFFPLFLSHVFLSPQVVPQTVLKTNGIFFQMDMRYIFSIQ